MKASCSGISCRVIRAIPVVLAVSFLCACGNNSGNGINPPALLTWTDTVTIDHRTPAISISNTTDSSARFHLDLNNRFPLSTKKMLLQIKDISTTDSIPVPQAAWRFVSDHTYHLSTYSEGQWIHDPFKLINSLAGGLCDDRAETLALIWEKLGYESRVTGLSGHVVPEVSVNSQWQLYDPDYEVYYVDDEGNTVGVRNLERNACSGLRTIGKDSIKQLMVDCTTRDSDNLMLKYTTTGNNIQEKWNTKVGLLEDDSFTLPPEAELIFMNGEGKNPTMAVVRLTRKSSGTLRIPLIPYAWKGQGILRLRKEEYHIGPIDTFLFPNNRFHDSVTVLEVHDTAYIYYHVNPKLCGLQATNLIKIEDASAKLNITATQNTPRIQDEQQTVAMYFEDKKISHLPFLRHLSTYNDSILNRQMLRELYREFLLLDESIREDRQTAMMLRFNSELNMTRDTLHMDTETYMTVINRHFPRSVFFIFLTMRYNTYRYFQSHVLSDPDVQDLEKK